MIYLPKRVIDIDRSIVYEFDDNNGRIYVNGTGHYLDLESSVELLKQLDIPADRKQDIKIECNWGNAVPDFYCEEDDLEIPY